MSSAPKPYPEVAASPDFPKIEEQVLAYWQQEKIFEASVENRPAKKDGKSNEFIFYDGPPFANGLPHYGHLLTGFVKDAVARYQTMLGHRVERRFGWDCHGLPAEMGAEKELGISGRQAILGYGMAKFNDYCRTSVMKYTKEWEYYVTRQARWVDFAHDYKTMDKSYMESVLWAFKQLYDKGWIYEAYRVMPYSWAAETPLSNFETRLDNSYRERVDKAITVAFELKEVPRSIKLSYPEVKHCKILAWTTTPWTLPSNLALAVSTKMVYDAEIKGDTAIIASLKYAESHFEEGNLPLNKQKLLTSLHGESLVGLHYIPLFPYFENHQPDKAFRILDGSDFVTDADGTGIVHMAPGFGEDDQRVCEAASIELVCPVDYRGRFTDEIFDIDYETSAPINPPPACGGTTGGWRLGEGPSTTRNPEAMERAEALRKNPTEAEKKLWSVLSGKKLEGFKFRRQQSIGKYIVDFVCMEKQLVIELDGSQHAEEQNAYDKERTMFLNDLGFRVLRFWNNDVLQNIEGVAEKILEELNHPPVSPRQRGEIFSLKGLNIIEENVEKFKFGEANERIIEWLKKHGQLIKQEQITHNYPHCWRTDKPLIYRAVPSWYVEVTKFRDNMVKLNQQINWIPENVRDGLFGKWLENARDWSISRNRFWGTPIPVWRSKSGKIKVFGSINELEKASGQKITDLHRPQIDEIIITEGSEEYRRVEDVFDCWFESGSMPFAQVHYPFENKEWFEKHFPADFIVEYAAQTRGWFYTLMVLGTALFDKPPFKNCICHGVVLDDKGQKLSKRLNNYADPKDIFSQFGADALRWFMLSSPVMRGLELHIDKEGKFIRDVVRLAIKPIWNAYNFFCMYANADGVKAILLLSPRLRGEEQGGGDIMDRYILAKCRQAVEKVRTALDAYDTPSATEAVSQFFETLNNWYIRRSKERFWKEEKDADKQAAYDTLYTVLHVMCRASAPLLPLTLEDVYRGLTGEKSVHLADYPSIEKDTDLVETRSIVFGMDWVREICNAALAIRNRANIRIRQPLKKLLIVGSSIHGHPAAADFISLILDEVNVKQLENERVIANYADSLLQLNNPVLGKRLPEKMKEIIPAAKKGNWKRLESGEIEVAGEKLKPTEFILLLEPKSAHRERAQALTDNHTLVILDTTVTPELEAEGYARDLVRLIQQARKEAGLHVSDRIALKLRLSQKLAGALDAHRDYIMAQVLASSLEIGDMQGSAFITNELIGEEEVSIGISIKAAA